MFNLSKSVSVVVQTINVDAMLSSGVVDEVHIVYKGKEYKLEDLIPPATKEEYFMEFKKDVVRNDFSKEKEEAQQLFYKEDYKGVCDIVDGVYGWKPGEIKRPIGYTKEAAEIALRSL